MRLSFEKIKEISEWLDTNQEIKFYEFINSFEGENIYQKFKNILIKWEYHVNDYLTFTIDGSQTKIPIFYLLQELTDDIQSPKVFSNDYFSFELQIPKTFQPSDQHTPIYDLISSISINDVYLDFNQLSRENKQIIIAIWFEVQKNRARAHDLLCAIFSVTPAPAKIICLLAEGMDCFGSSTNRAMTAVVSLG
jgi:hypothetical protein